MGGEAIKRCLTNIYARVTLMLEECCERDFSLDKDCETRAPSRNGPSCGILHPIPRVLHIPHSIIILVYNVEILLIFYGHKILYGSRERKVKDSSILYVYLVIQYSLSFFTFLPRHYRCL